MKYLYKSIQKQNTICKNGKNESKENEKERQKNEQSRKKKQRRKKRMENVVNKNKGITLIALVITIIVLLILAGISIATLTGENGMLTKANTAKTQNEEATDLEMVRLAVTTGKLENITEGTEINAAIQKELRKTDSVATVEGDGEEKDITYNSKLYKINITTGTAELEKPFEKPNYNEATKTLKPGDFVTYDTGIDGVGKVLCRVLYDASSEYGLQIITNDCIKQNGEYVDLTFGGDDYRWSDSDLKMEEYNRVKMEYNNIIKILNEEASKYLNQTYIIETRCVGSVPNNKNSETKTTAIYKNKYNDEIDTEIKEADTNYESDYEKLEMLNLLNTNKSYWLASRYNKEGPIYFGQGIHFHIRTVGAEEDELPPIKGPARPYGNVNFVTHAMRPVFLLRGDLKITGNGTESSPYELGV